MNHEYVYFGSLSQPVRVGERGLIPLDITKPINVCRYERNLLRECLDGAVVHGVKVGSPGIDEDMLQREIALREEIMDRLENDHLTATCRR